MESVGDEYFVFGAEAIAREHFDQVVAGECWDAGRSHQVDANKGRRRQKRDCFRACILKVVDVVR